MDNDSILILGTGALATLFAYRLSVAGVAVTMLGNWPEGVTALRERGAGLEGAGSTLVRVTDDPQDCLGTKSALVLVKSWQTERAARQLSICLAADGLALTLQNGLGNDTILSGSLGGDRVSRGVTTLGATLLTPALVRLGGDGTVILESHPRLYEMGRMLRLAGFDVNEVADAESSIWGKLVVNAAINPLTALLRVKNGELLQRPAALNLVNDLANETASVADAYGILLPYPDPARTVEDVLRRTAGNISSMFQDVLRGSQTEVDAINGAVVRLGKMKSIQTPANQVIWSLVSALFVRGKI